MTTKLEAWKLGVRDAAMGGENNNPWPYQAGSKLDSVDGNDYKFTYTPIDSSIERLYYAYEEGYTEGIKEYKKRAINELFMEAKGVNPGGG